MPALGKAGRADSVRADANRHRTEGLAQGHVAGDRQNQNPTLGHRERQPDLVIEPAHNHFSTPQDPLTSNSSSDGIIAETERQLQEENDQIELKC